MPKTTVAVNFNGKDNGLSSLFSKLSSAVTKLDKELTSLDSTLARVDARLKAMQSSSSFLSSLGGKIDLGKMLGGGSGGGLGLNLGNVTGNLTNALTSGLSRAGSLVRSTFSGIVSTVKNAVSNSYQSITGFISYADKAVLMFGNSIKQIAQGIQSFGIAFSIFVSAPLGKLLSGVVSESVEFDDALVKIRKTTEASTSDIDKLGKSLTQLSLGLPETRQDLAAIAEDWGAVGVTIDNDGAVQQMTELVRLTAMLSSSTRGLNPQDAVEKLGKFAAIYYPDVADFVGEAEKLFSVISKLEDITPLDAGDILATAQRMASVTKALEIAPEKALALAAAVASVNASAERAGTQMATALNTMVVKTDKVAALFGTTEDNIKSLMSTHPEDFFLTIASSIAALEDPLERVRATQAVFGTTGGKALGGLAGSIENVAKIMAVANDEFVKGTYLQFQFDAALESTKNQLSILRNNLTYAGSAIGDAFLPYITKFVALAVPAIQMLTDWFKNLGENIKIQVLLWAALLTIAGPVVVFFSSMLFMIGLTISGLSSMFGVVMMVVKGLIGFGGIVLGLLNPINLLIAGLAGVAIYAVFLANDLLMAQDIVQSYISKAYQWGYNLISSFADGIRSAASAAYNAVVSVINAFIGLIQAFSPPREGPLTGIETWGENLMLAYADGIMASASAIANAASYVDEQLAGMLESLSPSGVKAFTDAFNGIKSIINTVGQHIGSTAAEINGRISGAANAVANFIANLRSGIPDDLTEIYDMLGGLGPRYEELIRLQETYTAGEARLKAIQSALKGISSETESLISNVVAQNGLTSDQQAAMIRRIKLEQAAKETALKREEESIQAQQDAIKDDIDKKQSIIDILASLIFPKEDTNNNRAPDERDRPDKPPKDDGIDPIPIVPFDPNTDGALDNLKDKFDRTGESAMTFTEKLGKAKLMIEGLVAGLRGDDPKLYSAMPEAFWQGFEKGKSVRKSVLDFLGKFDAFVRSMGTIKDVIKDGGLKFLLGIGDGASGKGLNWEAIAYMGLFSAALYVLGYIAGTVGQKVKDVFDYLFTKPEGSDEETPFEQLLTRITTAYNAFVEGFAENTKDIDWASFGSAVTIIAGALGLVATDEGVWKGIGQTLGGIVTIATELIVKLARLVLIIGLIFGVDDEKRFKEMYGDLKTATDETDGFWSSADKVYNAFKNIKQAILDAKTALENFRDIILGNKTIADPGITDGDIYQNTGNSAQGNITDGSIYSNAGKKAAEDWKQGYTDTFYDAATTEHVAKAISDMTGMSQIKSAELVANNGMLTAADYLWGIGSWFFEDTPVAEQMDKLTTSVKNWATNKTPDINKHGKDFGQFYLDGTGTLFTEQVAPDAAMNKLPPAISIWELANKTIIEDKGKTVGKDITKGVGDITGTDTGYMDTGVMAMWIWINENLQKLLDVGKSWGEGVINGIRNAFYDAGDALWGAISHALDWVYNKLPDWFLILIGRKPAEPEKPESDKKTKTKSVDNSVKTYTPYKPSTSTTSAQSFAPVYNINISVDGSSLSVRENAKTLADTIYKRLIQDGRLMR